MNAQKGSFSRFHTLFRLPKEGLTRALHPVIERKNRLFVELAKYLQAAVFVF